MTRAKRGSPRLYVINTPIKDLWKNGKSRRSGADIKHVYFICSGKEKKSGGVPASLLAVQRTETLDHVLKSLKPSESLLKWHLILAIRPVITLRESLNQNQTF